MLSLFWVDGCVGELPTPCEGRGARFFEAISTLLERYGQQTKAPTLERQHQARQPAKAAAENVNG